PGCGAQSELSMQHAMRLAMTATVAARAPHAVEEWGDQARRKQRVGAEPSSTDKSRKFLTNPVHASDSDLSSERF
ncbi:hypothetical protein J6590_043710, partial [Homalodisca vitripennis]